MFNVEFKAALLFTFTLYPAYVRQRQSYKTLVPRQSVVLSSTTQPAMPPPAENRTRSLLTLRSQKSRQIKGTYMAAYSAIFATQRLLGLLQRGWWWCCKKNKKKHDGAATKSIVDYNLKMAKKDRNKAVMYSTIATLSSSQYLVPNSQWD